MDKFVPRFKLSGPPNKLKTNLAGPILPEHVAGMDFSICYYSKDKYIAVQQGGQFRLYDNDRCISTSEKACNPSSHS
jgi:hypothetical protein